MKFRWTIPNILTIFRVVLIPVIMFCIFQDNLTTLSIAVVLFAVSAVTDALDGMIARKLNQTTEFGAHFDPLADKFLVWGLFAVFALTPGLHVYWWLVLFIVLRDLFVTFLRSYSRRKGIRFKTSLLAKAKTSVQMSVAFVILLYMLVTYIIRTIRSIPAKTYDTIWKTVLPGHSQWLVLVPMILTVLTVVFTVITAVDYYRTFRTEREKA